jgi:hypothetical protein
MKKMMKGMTANPRAAARNATRAVAAGKGRMRYGGKRKRKRS